MNSMPQGLKPRSEIGDRVAGDESSAYQSGLVTLRRGVEGGG